MSRPTLLVGIARPVTREEAQRMRDNLQRDLPHVEVLVVAGTDGMLLIPPPTEDPGETATAPAGAGSVTISISGDADPAEVGRRIAEYLDAHHRNTMRSRS